MLEVVVEPGTLDREPIELCRGDEADLGGLVADGQRAASDAGGVANVELAANLAVAVGNDVPGSV
jgi:hypothetical protein